MTEDELMEAFWGEGGWADRMYEALKDANSRGLMVTEICIDMNPPERYDFHD